MTYDCPRGHASSDADYCSECGIKIPDSSTVQAISAPPPRAAGDCPDCGTPRVPGARFCEVCRFDFANGASGTALDPGMHPASTTAPPPPPPAPDVSADVASPFYGKNAWAIVTAERALASSEDAVSFPADEPPRSYPLDFSENLVGRRNGKAGLHPEVPVNDPSVSSRHLKFCRRPSGMVLIDVGSTNGTKLNGTPVQAGVENAVAPGDTVDLGAWTRIVLEAR